MLQDFPSDWEFSKETRQKIRELYPGPEGSPEERNAASVRAEIAQEVFKHEVQADYPENRFVMEMEKASSLTAVELFRIELERTKKEILNPIDKMRRQAIKLKESILETNYPEVRDKGVSIAFEKLFPWDRQPLDFVKTINAFIGDLNEAEKKYCEESPKVSKKISGKYLAIEHVARILKIAEKHGIKISSYVENYTGEEKRSSDLVSLLFYTGKAIGGRLDKTRRYWSDQILEAAKLNNIDSVQE